MKIRGLVIILITVAIPWIWYGPMMGQFEPSAVFGQYLGASALILMGSMSSIGVDVAFGGLVYCTTTSLDVATHG